MRACSLLRRRIHSSANLHLPQFSFFSARAQVARQYERLPQSHPLARPYSTHSKQAQEASSLSNITLTLLAIGGGVWLYDNYSSPNRTEQQLLAHSQSQSRVLPQEPFLGVIDTLQTMPIEPAPGTVGNLTPEQEAKLQEFWVLTLKTFGVNLDSLQAEKASSSSTSETASVTAAKEEKKPKRRWGLWGRGDDDEADAKSGTLANGIASSLASINISDGDDKYGQSKEFQQALDQLQPEEMRTAFWDLVKHDNPDSLLLRFLRARKWDVKKALIMMISTMRWRLQDVHVDDDIMANGEAQALRKSQSSDPTEKKMGEEFLHQMRMGKSYLHGVDRVGRPICVIRVRLHRAAEQEVETLERFTVYTIETARLLLVPPVETATIVFDMTDFTLANMDYAPVKFMIKCFEANYPESLGTVLIHKAPWIFSSIWSIIKGWLDPVVAAKIHFTRNREDLETFISPTQIPKELEGDEDWDYKYVEVQAGENTKMEDKETRDKLIAQRQALAKDIQDATVEWLRASFKGEPEAASAAKEKRSGMIEQLRKQYWELDPYIRARSLYDRLNVIQGGGKIEFYPGAKKGQSGEGPSTEAV